MHVLIHTSRSEVTPFLQVSSSQSELSNRPWRFETVCGQYLLVFSALELCLLVVLSSMLCRGRWAKPPAERESPLQPGLMSLLLYG